MHLRAIYLGKILPRFQNTENDFSFIVYDEVELVWEPPSNLILRNKAAKEFEIISQDNKYGDDPHNDDKLILWQSKWKKVFPKLKLGRLKS